MIKRFAYQYENEVRLICYRRGESRDGLLPYNIGCPKNLIDQILIHPMASNDTCKLLKSLIGTILEHNESLKEIKVKRSKLHDLRLETVEHV